MDFSTAIRVCMSKYADFSGRARRSEYWYFMLFQFLYGFVAGIVTIISDELAILASIGSLIFFIPSLSVCVRRLHDTGKSGWYFLLSFIPILNFYILYLTFCDSEGDNKYGPNPKM